MNIMTHAKFYFNRLILTLIFGIRTSKPPLPLLGPDRVKLDVADRNFGLLTKIISCIGKYGGLKTAYQAIFGLYTQIFEFKFCL